MKLCDNIAKRDIADWNNYQHGIRNTVVMFGYNNGYFVWLTIVPKL